MLGVGLSAESHLMESKLKELENTGAALKNASKSGDAKLVKAARNFESYMMSFMYKQMYQSIQKSEMFGNSQHQNMFMGLYMDEVTKNASLSENGIANQLIKQYQKQMDQVSELDDINQTTKDVTTSLTSQIKTTAYKMNEDKTVAHIFKDFDAMVAKVEDKTSSEYGMRLHPISKKQRMHEGTDFALAQGTKVKAPSEGTVIFAGKKGGYGNAVIIDHGHGITSLYAHLSEILVLAGDKLGKNKTLGKVGSTGVSTGPHLHFEVRRDGNTIDPKHLVSE